MKRFFLCLVVAVVIPISGCTGEGSGGAENAQTSASSEWDPKSWKSDIEISPKFTSEEDKLAFRKRWLERNTRTMGVVDPPDIALVEWMDSPHAADEKQAECLRSKGFSAEVAPQGGIMYDPPIPESQQEAFGMALYECHSMYFLDPEFLANLTEDQLRVQWDYWDEYYIPCLAAHGFTVDTSERPGREAYATTFYSDAEHRWWPDNKGELSFRITPEVMKVCPEAPPITEFYGID
ncbi:hypothetical protein [Actinotignum sp. GS-2025b]|uniref:hypothetical protein n=1 Tax=Actinotignum sp. GS-2025b TaxID=3427275 RepID=UPI003F4550F2